GRVRRRLAGELVDGAVLGVLVLAPAVELGPVADAPGGDVVEADLDHELGAQLDPLEVAPLAPAAGLARAALAGLVGRELLDQVALLLSLQARAVPDHAQVAALVVEAEDERADRALLLARAPAAHDRVDRAHTLDLHHPRPLAGAVGGGELLGDDALGAVQPGLGLLALARTGGQVDRLLHEVLEDGAPLLVRDLEQGVVVAREHVERDEARGGLAGQALDARAGGMDALAQGFEVLDAAFPEHDDLAVEDVAPGREVELGEVAAQVAAVARMQGVKLAVHERERAEAVPLGLVGPALALGQRGP